MVYFGSWGGYAYALEAATGELIWKFNTGAVDTSIAIASGTVYIGSYDGHLYALDAESGELLWRYLPIEKTTYPLEREGAVYLSACADHICALNAESGDLLWIYSTPRDVLSAPEVGEGHGLLHFSVGLRLRIRRIDQ